MTQDVPVIDLTPLIGGDASDGGGEVVDAIGAACRDWGFFQVVNHGIPEALSERVWSETRQFFALTRGEKLAISRTKENPRGYYDRELTKNARDLKEVFDFGSVRYPELPDDHPENRAAIDGYNQWPGHLSMFRPTMLEYFKACEDLGLMILEAFCLSLGAPRDFLHHHFTPDHTSFLRLNYYPLRDPLDSAESATITPLGDMALHHHTDAGALTILLQDDSGGLQVKTRGGWVDAPPVRDSFVCNLGDMLDRMTGGLYRSTPHRVRNVAARGRLSFPFFFDPNFDARILPIDLPGADTPHDDKDERWDKASVRDFEGTYGDYVLSKVSKVFPELRRAVQ